MSITQVMLNCHVLHHPPIHSLRASKDCEHAPSAGAITPTHVLTPPTALEGVTISFSNDGDMHPLQIKRRLSLTSNIPANLSDFTSQGFLPFQPESLMTTRKHLPRRNSETALLRRPLSDAEVDKLSYLYSTNFDPSKGPPSKGTPSKGDTDVATTRNTRVRLLSDLSEDDVASVRRTSISDTDLHRHIGH